MDFYLKIGIADKFFNIFSYCVTIQNYQELLCYCEEKHSFLHIFSPNLR